MRLTMVDTWEDADGGGGWGLLTIMIIIWKRIL